jgi:hypothetical protein
MHMQNVFSRRDDCRKIRYCSQSIHIYQQDVGLLGLNISRCREKTLLNARVSVQPRVDQQTRNQYSKGGEVLLASKIYYHTGGTLR